MASLTTRSNQGESEMAWMAQQSASGDIDEKCKLTLIAVTMYITSLNTQSAGN